MNEDGNKVLKESLKGMIILQNHHQSEAEVK